MNLEIPLTSRLQERNFQASRRRIETGMQDGRIGFTRTREQIRTAFEQDTLEAGQSKIAENCATHNSATDYGNIEGWNSGWRAGQRYRGNIIHYWFVPLVCSRARLFWSR